MKKAWRSYGVDAELKAKSLNKIITQGTANADIIAKNRRNSKRLQQNKRSIL